MMKHIISSSKLVQQFLIKHTLDVNPRKGYCKSENKCEENQSVTQLIRHNLHQECEEGLNEQINCELYASYTYYSMANCLSRPDVALLGFAKFFLAASQEEQVHAQNFVDFLNMRGGTVQLLDIIKPESAEYHNPELALEESIALEKNVLKSIEELHKKASNHNDLVLMDLLESQYLPEQYKGLQQLGEMLTNVRRVGSGIGLVLLDQELLRNPPATHSAKP